MPVLLQSMQDIVRSIRKHLYFRRSAPALWAGQLGCIQGSYLYPSGSASKRTFRQSDRGIPGSAVAAAVYAVLLVGLKAIDEEGLRDMPMGTKMIRILKKVRLL